MRARFVELGVTEGCNGVGSLLFAGHLLLAVIGYNKSRQPLCCLVVM